MIYLWRVPKRHPVFMRRPAAAPGPRRTSSCTPARLAGRWATESSPTPRVLTQRLHMHMHDAACVMAPQKHPLFTRRRPTPSAARAEQRRVHLRYTARAIGLNPHPQAVYISMMRMTSRKHSLFTRWRRPGPRRAASWLLVPRSAGRRATEFSASGGFKLHTMLIAPALKAPSILRRGDARPPRHTASCPPNLPFARAT